LFDKAQFEMGLLANTDNFGWLDDASIDFVLTDPPFNIARDTNFHTWEKNTINSFRFDADKGWDTYSDDQFRLLLREWSVEFHRVLRKGGNFAIFCADVYVSDLISALSSAGLKPKRTITWRKPNAVPVNRKHLMMSSCEYIVTGVKGSNATFNSTLSKTESRTISLSEATNVSDKISNVIEQAIRQEILDKQLRPDDPESVEVITRKVIETLPNAMFRAAKIYNAENSQVELCVPNLVTFNSKSGNRLHPTEKPVDLLMYLIELFSSKDDQILDPFGGSGSTAEAAIRLSRNFTLVEKDPEFFEKSRSRLDKLIHNQKNQIQY